MRMRPSASCECPEPNRLEYGLATGQFCPVAGLNMRSFAVVVDEPEYINTLPVRNMTMLAAAMPRSNDAPHCPAGSIVKLTPATSPPVTVTVWLRGVNVKPGLFGTMVNVPFDTCTNW